MRHQDRSAVTLLVLSIALAACGTSGGTSTSSPGEPVASGGGDCSSEACGPRPQMPSHPCPDGVTIAGPACERDASGRCTWVTRSCPAEEPLPAGGGGAPADGRACGGMQGLACADGELCVYARDAHCGAADQTGVCRPRPEVCAEIYAPVCGCDDRTYGNECDAHRAGVSVASDGECAGGGAAAGGGGGERPCGSRGMAPCAATELCDFAPDAHCGATDRPGVCRPRPTRCTREYAPVCGCDGQTHPTRCTANSQGVSVAHDGPC